jgi:hypothetical protein
MTPVMILVMIDHPYLRVGRHNTFSSLQDFFTYENSCIILSILIGLPISLKILLGNLVTI